MQKQKKMKSNDSNIRWIVQFKPKMSKKTKTHSMMKPWNIVVFCIDNFFCCFKALYFCVSWLFRFCTLFAMHFQLALDSFFNPFFLFTCFIYLISNLHMFTWLVLLYEQKKNKIIVIHYTYNKLQANRLPINSTEFSLTWYGWALCAFTKILVDSIEMAFTITIFIIWKAT